MQCRGYQALAFLVDEDMLFPDKTVDLDALVGMLVQISQSSGMPAAASGLWGSALSSALTSSTQD